VCEILDSAITLGAAERLAYLERSCGGDPDLRREVESLLRSHDQADDFLQAPPPELIAASFATLPAATLVGRRIGVYQILEEIGRGGMGEVYRAVRADGQYDRQVAIKVVRVGWNSTVLLERFRQERQILASLEHPNIARLYDGGTDEDGLPYLVMELIEGERIDAYCDRRALSIDARLRLFGRVCDAVQYAHQRLVIHRDIKPGNILVTADGVPKLLDFGLAKFLQADEQSVDPTLFRPLTPAYASPEQVRGETLTTASDVYSLGVVLYELLTGCSPYRTATRTSLELSQAVARTEPRRPSAALTAAALNGPGLTAAETAESISRARGSSPSRLRRQLAGDLDSIVLTALRKEPERRYGSVQQFAQDIERHLQGLPVLAIRGRWRYQAGKFMVRNKTVVAAAAAVMAALVGGILVSTHQAHIAQAERARAEARFNDIRKLANALIFDVNEAMADTPGNTAVRKLLLDRAVEYLDKLSKDAAGNPDLQRELAWGYQKLADVQGNETEANLGQVSAAEQSLRKAAALFAAVARARPASIEDGLNLAMIHRSIAVSDAYYPAGREQIALALATTARLAALYPRNLQVAWERSLEFGIQGFTQNVGGDRSAALQSERQALSLAQEVQRTDPLFPHIQEGLAKAMLRLGNQLSSSGFQEEAEQRIQDAVAMYEQLAARGSNPQLIRATAQARMFLGRTRALRGHMSAAQQSLDQAYSAATQLLKIEPEDNALQWVVLSLAFERGRLRILAGHDAEAFELFRPALARYAKPIDDDAGPGGGLVQAWLGRAYVNLRQYPRALQAFNQSAEAIGKDAQFADVRCGVAADFVMIGEVLLAQRRVPEAAEAYRKALAQADVAFTQAHGDTPALYPIADAQAGLGDVARARAEASRGAEERARYRDEACSYYAQSAATSRRIPEPARFSPSQFPSGDSHRVAMLAAACRDAGSGGGR
jgi:non-specific serine/threonine protein kinase/serine/threonine-protein kinase